MSKTPRTDIRSWQPEDYRDLGDEKLVVDAEFSRQLELEIQELNQRQVERTQAHLQAYRKLQDQFYKLQREHIELNNYVGELEDLNNSLT